ncbi:tetratricopeptide repeat protein [Bacillus rhizoplanae]|uniref:tetratricopeptide repeat protein n=1 Tax=Bacillus rhizoplanae TaxID=2880966 RepID=UPI003D1ABE3A
MENLLKKAIQLRNERKFVQSKEILLGLINFTQDSEILYQCAWTHDVMGMETEAALYYERAIELGLEGESLRGAYIGLGSTYRCIGEYDKAIATLETGIKRYPDDDVMKVFLSMAKYNIQSHEEAMKLLLDVAMKTESVKTYAKAIAFYKERLNEIFK